MPVTGLNSFSALSPLSPAGQPQIDGAGSAGSGNFGSLIKNAVESMDGTQKAAEQEVAKAVTGESPDLHQTIIALQSADLNFQLGMQVRNKLMGAYEEIMRMQV